MWPLCAWFALGAASAVLGPSWPVVWSLLAVGSSALALRFPVLRWPFALALVAWLWTSWVAHAALDARVIQTVDKTVDGCVISPVIIDGNRMRFTLRVPDASPGLVAQRLRLAWYDATQVPAEGECWRLHVRLRPPRGLLNHTGDDPERRAFLLGVHGYGTVRPAGGVERYGQSARSVGLHLRLQLARRIRFVAGEGRGHSLYVALSVGLRYSLTDEHWSVFRRTGTGHLISISGLHVGLIAGFGYLLGRWLVAPSAMFVSARGLDVDARFGWGTALLCATVYAALAGFSLPTVRALIMTSVFACAALARAHLARRDVLAIALLLVLLVAPLSIIRPGTWLSFGAVGVLLTLGVRLDRGLFAAQSVVFAGLLPVMAVFMGQLCWVSPLANAICVPLFSLLIIPLTLLLAASSVVTPIGASAGFAQLEWVVDQTWSLLSALASLPWTDLVLPAPNAWRVALAIGGVGIWLCALPPGRQTVLAITACVPLLLARERGPAFGDVSLEVYDVGQALSVKVRTRRHTLVYDTGARWRRRDAGAFVVVPQLHSTGIRRLDRIIVSHRDLDHRGGLLSVRGAFRDAKLIVGEPLDLAPEAQHHCRDVPPWRWDGVHFSFVHPPAGRSWHGNNASCVLRIDARAGSALITGDAEALAELSMVHGHQPLRADLVIGQHHGSATSSTATFVDATAASIVVFSTGLHNQWGLPSPVVVERWEAAGAQVWTTALEGGLKVKMAGESGQFEVHSARRARGALWRAANQTPR
ncbi:MAG: DNA internalization-related competence protein ComEC/Rec2 [Gammaproteobacteria bacterium]